jgi:acylphosphatase
VKHVDIRVQGRVQGVCFRESTRREAQRLGVAGTVRNDPDGSVFIQAEGEEKPLAKLVAWCRTGPPAAEVTRLDVAEGVLRGYDGFRVTF